MYSPIVIKQSLIRAITGCLALNCRRAVLHNRYFRPSRPVENDRPTSITLQESARVMKAKSRHRKSYKWRKRCDSSPVAKGRRAKIHGKRNPRKRKHLGGRGL